MRIDKVTAV